MIAPDTSIWVGHFISRNERLSKLLVGGQIVMHPFVFGELALGGLPSRRKTLEELSDLPKLQIIPPNGMMQLIEGRRIYSRGIGYVDASLLASCLATPGTALWTDDRRLSAAAREFKLPFPRLLH